VLWLLVYLVAANIISFAMFGIDKQRAREGRRRISERALLTSALVSGTIGAWVGMSTFRHKTAKRSFQMKMVAVTAVDAAVVAIALLATR
jgi:uncharacterized membrane protein YsdA (DUF1294 family)